jgi:hypothetical protein
MEDVDEILDTPANDSFLVLVKVWRWRYRVSKLLSAFLGFWVGTDSLW